MVYFAVMHDKKDERVKRRQHLMEPLSINCLRLRNIDCKRKYIQHATSFVRSI